MKCSSLVRDDLRGNFTVEGDSLSVFGGETYPYDFVTT